MLVTVQPFLERADDVGEFLTDEADLVLEQALLSGQTIGSPLMRDAQLRALEKDFKRRIRPPARGRPAGTREDRRQQEINVIGKVVP